MSEPVMLTIAGSDPSGGAGVQADLKTATALGVYGASVLTALTAQNTTGVRGIHPVPAAFVGDQLDAVLDDLDVRAVKIGMLGDAEVIEAIASRLRERPEIPLVLDPVMVATSGDRLIPEAAVAAIVELLLPITDLATPNLPEAAVLAGFDVRSLDDFEAAGRAVLARGARNVLVKGGHLDGQEVVDVLVSADGAGRLINARIDTPNTHGTGCTLSAAVASRLALGDLMADAVVTARGYLQRALVASVDRRIGAGHGPVDHLVDLRAEG